MAKKKKKVCKVCKDTGYLVIHANNIMKFVHGQFPVPETTGKSIPEIQKCDACDWWGTDDRAQGAYLDDVRLGVAKLPRLLLLWGPVEPEKRKRNG